MSYIVEHDKTLIIFFYKVTHSLFMDGDTKVVGLFDKYLHALRHCLLWDSCCVNPFPNCGMRFISINLNKICTSHTFGDFTTSPKVWTFHTAEVTDYILLCLTLGSTYNKNQSIFVKIG